MVRTWVLGATVAVWAGLAGAHGDHGSAAFDISITGLIETATGTQIDLSVASAHDAPVQLQAIYREDGTTLSANLPQQVGDGAAQVRAHLPALGDLPGIFVLVLDFGEAGMGPITVVPGSQ